VKPQSGRDEVLKEFVKHRSRLFALVLSIVRNFDVAEEVLQEVAVVVCDQWNEFRPGTNFVAWAARIARNKIYTISRAARREVLLSPEAVDSLIEASAAESRAGWLEAVQKCLEGLEKGAREVLELRYGRDLGGRDIAERLKSTTTAVHMALSRARVALARCVEGRLAEREAGA
jgi:RNA polymerase sigma-70 factor (ECF subfamily)